MSAGLLAGALIGGGLWAIASGVWPAREPLSVVLNRSGSPQPEALGRHNLDARLGAWARRLTPVDRAIARVRADIRVLGRDPNEQAAQMLTSATTGILWGPFVVLGLVVIGIKVPLVVPVALAVAGGLLGVIAPARELQTRAARRRADFAYGVAAFCDILSSCLASGRTTKEAIDRAAAAGDGGVFSELRLALHAGYLEGKHPWDALADLGAETGLEDLTELAAALVLAGEEGAAVRGIVRARAKIIRERMTSLIEQRGAEAAERMTMPTLVLSVGFITFWAYPAFATMTAL